VVEGSAVSRTLERAAIGASRAVNGWQRRGNMMIA
jgi:hypothetical protein